MGLFDTMKALIRFKRSLKQIVADAEKTRDRALSMTTEELAALPDDELYEAALSRVDSRMEAFDHDAEGLVTLPPAQRVLYVLNLLEMEVNNGGLCQFFVNSSRAVAPFVSEAMATVGAEEHRALFDGFVTRCDIDLTDLSAFDIQSVQDYEVKTRLYPFDEYDDAFYALDPLEVHLKAYVRAHAQEF